MKDNITNPRCTITIEETEAGVQFSHEFYPPFNNVDLEANPNSHVFAAIAVNALIEAAKASGELANLEVNGEKTELND